MKNKTAKKQTGDKGFFRKAGEVIGTIGHEIVEGKDKVVAASTHIIANLTGSAAPAKKKPTKKAIKKAAKKSSDAIKKTAGKVARKVIKKATKKVMKKAAKAATKN